MKRLPSLENRGTFNRDSLIGILYYLHDKKFTGELKLTIENDIIRLFWEGGNAKNIWQANTPEPLGRVLFDLGLIDMEAYNQSLIKMTQNGKKQGEVLLEMGRIDAKQLNSGLKVQLQRKLNRLFYLSSGKYEVVNKLESELTSFSQIPMLVVIYNGIKNTFDESRAIRLLGGKEFEFELNKDFDAFTFSLPLEEEEIAAISSIRKKTSFKKAIELTKLSSLQLGILLNYLELLDLISIYPEGDKAAIENGCEETDTRPSPAPQTAKIERPPPIPAEEPRAGSLASSGRPDFILSHAEALQEFAGEEGPEAPIETNSLPPLPKQNGNSQKSDVVFYPKTDRVTPVPKRQEFSSKTTPEPRSWKRPSSGRYATTEGRPITVKTESASPPKPKLADLDVDKLVSFYNSLSKMSYYEMLGVRKIASSNEVKNAYYSLAKNYHPDKYHSHDAEIKEICEEVTAAINRAFTTLSNEASRKEYDERLRAKFSTGPTKEELSEAEQAFKEGMNLLASQNMPEAEKSFLRAAALSPNESRYYTMLGVAQYNFAVMGVGGADYLIKAEESLAAAVKLDIHSPEAHFNLSQVCERLDQLDRALGHAERAISLSPNRQDYLAHLDFVKKRKGDSELKKQARLSRENGSSKEGGLLSKLPLFGKRK